MTSRPAPPPSAPRYGVVVPVKPPAVAKSRLAALGDHARTDLVEAFAADTVEAALTCRLVAAVLVVTDDHRLAASLAALGAEVVPDATTEDLNASLDQGAAELLRRHPALRPACLCADLPALRPDELAVALGRVPEDRGGFLTDAAGTGTTLLAAPDRVRLAPGFGSGSAARHRAAGLAELDVTGVRSVRLDVDTPADLTAAVSLGVGVRTRWVLTRHSL